MMANELLFTSRQRAITFRNPKEVIAVTQPSGVAAALCHIESEVAAGKYAAGFLSYEAAPAFDPASLTHAPAGVPVLWFGLYGRMEINPPLKPKSENGRTNNWIPALSREEYNAAIARIRAYIAAGDTYQVNYTLPLRSTFHGDARSWFDQLCRAQRADYCAYLKTDSFDVLSLSPELFFRLEGEQIEMRPMKGTRPRGLYPHTDRGQAQDLAASEKDRAENVMIVDLIRNDLGKICETGSVEVKNLFQLERYETLWQMTSTVTGRTRSSLPGIFSALFPSGSVTGAPKIRTMEIIRELEPFPRGVYCGSIGWWAPGRRAEFNVAIRTITLDHRTGAAEYHVGGGITWDSTALDEFAECQTKAAVLTRRAPEFDLLETLLWNGAYAFLNGHLARLAASADYFGFAFDRPKIIASLEAAAQAFEPENGAMKVRLLLARTGGFRIEASILPPVHTGRVGFAAEPVCPGDVFLYHKTTHREAYETAKRSRPGCDDVLLWNTRGEVTESAIANIAVDIGGALYTPPVACGLLAGVFRAELLASGKIRERVLTKQDVREARAVYLLNSVRGWREVTLEKTENAGTVQMKCD